MVAPSDVSAGIAQVREEGLTYLSERCLQDIADAVSKADADGLEGILIEAGTALGGSAIVMALAKSPERRMRAYDAFDMIPPPTEKDGEDVHKRYEKIKAGKSKGIGGAEYYGYRDDLLGEVTASFERFGVPIDKANVELVKGYFEDTLSVDEPVAFAHLDGDWYSSTMTCLERIWPRLVVGGRLVIDDYFKWSGCRTAIDEYFDGLEGFEKVKLGRLHIVKTADVPVPERSRRGEQPQTTGAQRIDAAKSTIKSVAAKSAQLRAKPSKPKALRFINNSRQRLRAVNRGFAKTTEPDMLVLDAGAGRGPYRTLFKHAKYETADFGKLGTNYTDLDYVCDLTDIPVEDGRYDRVLFNQVLEHMKDPQAVINELYRVLKPGGEILCTCPLTFHEHQKPYDFFRYTKYGLRHLFETAGFDVVKLKWLEGYFGTVAYQFRRMSLDLPKDPRTLETGWRLAYLGPLLWGTRGLATGLAVAYSRAEKRWRYTKSGTPKNYLVLARKPV